MLKVVLNTIKPKPTKLFVTYHSPCCVCHKPGLRFPVSCNVCRGCFVKMRGDRLFCWYWWNCYLGTDQLTCRRGGGVMVFDSFRIFFLTTRELEYFFFSRAKREIAFQNLTLGYMTITLNQRIRLFCFPPPKSEYFFQQYWESEYFFRKKTQTPPLQSSQVTAAENLWRTILGLACSYGRRWYWTPRPL